MSLETRLRLRRVKRESNTNWATQPHPSLCPDLYGSMQVLVLTIDTRVVVVGPMGRGRASGHCH
jgi:hypothetical protein